MIDLTMTGETSDILEARWSEQRCSEGKGNGFSCNRSHRERVRYWRKPVIFGLRAQVGLGASQST
jgi:hypothetical protein